MPIVRVEMFPGRTQVVKQLLARGIVDAFFEIAGTHPRDAVHVLLEDVARESWAIGNQLPWRAPTADVPIAAPHVTVSHVRCKPSHAPQFLAWQREFALPTLAAFDGFISSMLLTSPQEPDSFTMISKWVSVEAVEEFANGREARELREQSLEYLQDSESTIAAGKVVDVLHERY